MELFGELRHALPGRQQAHDLELAIRQAVVRQLLGRPVEVVRPGLAESHARSSSTRPPLRPRVSGQQALICEASCTTDWQA